MAVKPDRGNAPAQLFRASLVRQIPARTIAACCRPRRFS
jgi:hypothetical protein